MDLDTNEEEKNCTALICLSSLFPTISPAFFHLGMHGLGRQLSCWGLPVPPLSLPHHLPGKLPSSFLHFSSSLFLLLERGSTPPQSYFLLQEKNSHLSHMTGETSSSESLLGVPSCQSKKPLVALPPGPQSPIDSSASVH